MANIKTTNKIITRMGTINPIPGNPEFMTLWHIENKSIVGAKNIKYRLCTYGYAGNIITPEYHAFLSTTAWYEPTNTRY